MGTTTSNFAPEQYRGVLLLLAWTNWDDVLDGWGNPSDLVQQTLLEALQKLGTFNGNTTAAFVAGLRAILAHNMHDVIRGLRRGKRDCHRTTSLDAALEESSARLG